MTRILATAVLLVLGSLLFSTTIIVSKLASLSGAPMLWFLACSMGFAGVLLLCAATGLGDVKDLRASVLRYGLIAGLFLATYSAIGFLSVAHVGASYVSLTLILPVLLTYIPAVFLRIDVLSAAKVFAVGCGTAGGLVLAFGKLSTSQTEGIALWIILVTLNPLLMAASNIYRTRYWPERARPLLLAALLLLFGTSSLVPVAIWFEGLSAVTRLITNPVLAVYTCISIALFAVQYPIILGLQRLAGPVILSMIGPLASASGATMAFVWLSEPMPRGLFLACLLMLLGIAVFQMGPQTRRGKR